MMNERLLRMISSADVREFPKSELDGETLAIAAKIVNDIQRRGEAALIEHARRLGDLHSGGRMIYHCDDFSAAFNSLPPEKRNVIERTGQRIRAFAQAQRNSLTEFAAPIDGGRAGQTIAPVESVGCYAPGGRYPLPSSVLMTAIPARVAGVQQVWAASPHPQPETLAACAVAQVDHLLAIGGAQAIAALAYGAGEIPPCRMIVGPGNRFVTAAKKIVYGDVGVDMPAGPSELVVLADNSADPAWLAADLLAQAEHDPDAIVVLIATDRPIVDRVEHQLAEQLPTLPTADIARRALQHSFAVTAADLAEGIALCNRLAPEHLSLQIDGAEQIQSELRHYGALFIGAATAQVLGDYGAGPNHVLPTGGTSHYSGGLSVFHFLRIRTWMQIDRPVAASSLYSEAACMAQMEGLVAHAESVKMRLR